MAADPSYVFGSTLHPLGGWMRSAKINGILCYCDSASISQSNNYTYTKYALTFPSGERQKVLHSRGTRELTWTVSGDLTYESMDLLNFLNPHYRGLKFPVAILNSGYEAAEELSICMMESFSLSASSDASIKFTISGKSLSNLASGTAWSVSDHKYPVPSWSSGNDLLRSWTVTHNTSLQANWHNSQNTLPTYYRPSESEYTMTVQSMSAFRQYDTISLGVGTFSFINGIVTSRSVNYSGKEPKTYECQITNVNPLDEPLTPGVVVTMGGDPPSDWI